jgi:hypothetical protein
MTGILLAAILAQEGAPAPAFEREIRPLLESFCFKCHGPEKPKAGINLSAFKDEAAVQRDSRAWEKVLRQLREREMPPEGKSQPSPEQRDKLVSWIGKALASIDYSKLPRDPGRVLIHRLSRTEYNNTIRDLLGVDTRPADKFPADGGGGAGFDNNADVLFVPPLLMEKYLEAAGEVLDQADPKRVFIARPGAGTAPAGAARVVLEYFARRAFRRPAGKDEVDRLFLIFDRASKRGASYEDAVKLALKGALVSPKFLFRVEEDRDSKEPYPVGDYEQASRLSYFIWCSMPDEELFRRAGEGKLHDPKALEEQVRRMLRDPKARAFADDFAGQWLGVRDLRHSAAPDRGRFPEFTPSLRDAMIVEAVEFFHGVIREDASLLDLVQSDYTYLNEELAKHYGVAGVKGPEMRRVKLPDPNRGGVLGMGAMHVLTSYPLRTSPVLRGRWVLDELLGTPPPPPPANVGVLPTDDKPKEGKTFRQRLEAHRTKPQCAACHRRIDPIGFGLENFDPIGRWRTEIAGQPVDASGELPGGEKFKGPEELRKVLLARKDDFLRNLAEKMLSYALGRGLEPYDAPALKEILAEVAKNDTRASALILGVARSYPFLYRRNAPPERIAK